MGYNFSRVGTLSGSAVKDCLKNPRNPFFLKLCWFDEKGDCQRFVSKTMHDTVLHSFQPFVKFEQNLSKSAECAFGLITPAYILALRLCRLRR